MKAKRIKDKNTVKAKDGRTMHKNSLVNIEKGETTRWKPGQSGNPNGRPRNPVLLAKEQLSKILDTEYWNDNKEKEKTVTVMLKHAIEDYLACTDTEDKQSWYRLLVGSSDSQVKNEQVKNTPMVTNVVLLPSKQDTPGQERPDPSMEIGTEE